MKRIFLLTLPLFLFAVCATAVTPRKTSLRIDAPRHGDIPSPDFAFPRDVIADADTRLAKAVESGDAQAMLRALIDGGLAACAIDADSLPAFINRVAAYRAEERRPAVKSLLATLQATALSRYYSSKRGKIADRTDVDVPEDSITLMGAGQIKRIAGALCRDALADVRALEKSPLTDWTAVIEINDASRPFYPSLLGFTAARWIDLLAVFSDTDACASTARLWLRAVEGEEAPQVAATLAAVNCDRTLSFDDRRERLVSLWRSDATNPYAIEYLIAAGPEIEDYPVLRDFARKNPGYVRIGAVKEAMARLCRPQTNAWVQAVAVPGDSVAVTLTLANVGRVNLSLFKVSDGFTGFTLRDKLESLGQPLQTRTVNIGDSVPYASFERTVKFAPLPYGRYAVVLQIDGKKPELQSNSLVFSVTELSLLHNSMSAIIAVVNPKTGRPQQGATLRATGGENIIWTNPKSDAEGFAALPKGLTRNSRLGNMRVWPAKGDDKAAQRVYGWQILPYGKTRPMEERAASVVTSLPLYHPGDTLEFMAVGYAYTPSKRRLLADTQLRAVLRDANYEPYDTLTVRSDGFGRIYGKSTIPTDRLTGQYMVEIYTDTGKNSWLGQAQFEVAEYRMPKITVALNEPELTDSVLTLRGSAATYSGIPLAGIAVDVTVASRRPLWRHMGDADKTIARDTVYTAADGTFALTLAASLFDTREYPLAKATATVVASDGEKAAASTDFTIGNERFATVTLQSPNICADRPARLRIGVLTPLGNPVDSEVLLTLVSKSDSLTLHSETVGGFAEVAFDTVPSGEYTLTVSAADAQPSAPVTVFVYRQSDTGSPSSSPLWVEKTDISATAPLRNFNVLFATADTAQPVLATLSENGRLTRQWWLPASSTQMRRLAVELTADTINDATLNLTAVKDYAMFSRDINLSVTDPAEELQLEVSAMRNRVTPGTTETLTFKTTDADGAPRQSALLLDIYSQALDAIVRHTPSVSFRKAVFQHPALYFALAPADYMSVYTPLAAFDYQPLQAPAFNFYGRDFSPYVYFNGIRDMKYSAGGIRSSMKSTVTDECAEEKAVCEDAVAVMDSDSGVNGAVNGQSGSQTEYRQPETPLALFAPMLATDSLGTLKLTFSWPGANTTWNAYATAFGNNLSTATANWATVAARPLMVTANPPRFLRQGDSAQVVATVSNATDSAFTAAVTLSLLDAVTLDNLIPDKSAEITVPANGSATVELPVVAPVASSAVIMRIKAVYDRFTDAEQHLIPIAPANGKVVESNTFFIPADSTGFRLTLPSSANQADATLTLTTNPLWEIAAALPGMRPDNVSTSPEAARSLFSLLTLKKIIDANPGLTARLSRWIAENASSRDELAKINRQPQLKQLLLKQTPFAGAAEAETRRLLLLGELLDTEKLDAAISEAIGKLLSFRDARTGGFFWGMFPGATPSEWATEAVLLTLSDAAGSPGLPRKELDGAMRYLDRKVAEQTDRDRNYAPLSFAWLASCYNSYTPSAKGREAINRVTAAVEKSWRKDPLSRRGFEARLMWRNGKTATADELLGSLTQYSVYDPAEGRRWPSAADASWLAGGELGQTAANLYAYAEILPSSAINDQVRQWLVYDKLSTTWGNTLAAAQAAGAVLSTGTDWTTLPDSLSLSVGGTPLALSAVDTLSGTVNATVKQSGADLVIDGLPRSPAWGSLIAVSTAPMATTVPHSVRDLSVEKQYLVETAEGWKTATDFTVGQRVKVRLTLKARRNIDYLTVEDARAACFEPVVQTARTLFADGIGFYLENRDETTRLFIDRLPRGTYILEYELSANNAGTFASGVASVQSQYAPELAAHSAGCAIKVRNNE